MTTKTTYHTVKAAGVDIFYREAGSPEAPHVLLLHGLPSASHMFRELMGPLAAAGYHVVAPDYPGFGQSASLSRDEFTYTFGHLAQVVDAFAEAVELDSYALYVFDYGAPIGFRLALWHPKRVWAMVSQNGNVYREGLGPSGPRGPSTGQTPHPSCARSTKAPSRARRSSGSTPSARRREA